MKGFVLSSLIVIVGVVALMAVNGFWDSDSSEPNMIIFDATIVYLNASSFAIQDGELRDGEPVCVPESTVVGSLAHNEMLIMSYTGIWSNAHESRVTLREGVVRDGACVVDVLLPVPNSLMQTVFVGCDDLHSDEFNVSADGDWHARTLEYLGCVGRLESPSYWPAELVVASDQLRRDAKSALGAIGMSSERIEASRVAQPHPQTLDTCEPTSIRDTDIETSRLDEPQLAQLAKHWEEAGYDVITHDFIEDGPNNQHRVTARMDNVGTIRVSWRTIGPNGDPFIVELTTSCFERDLTLRE
jgi:hypothetical protein